MQEKSGDGSLVEAEPRCRPSDEIFKTVLPSRALPPGGRTAVSICEQATRRTLLERARAMCTRGRVEGSQRPLVVPLAGEISLVQGTAVADARLGPTATWVPPDGHVRKKGSTATLHQDRKYTENQRINREADPEPIVPCPKESKT